jgi:hypothetical protein
MKRKNWKQPSPESALERPPELRGKLATKRVLGLLDRIAKDKINKGESR